MGFFKANVTINEEDVIKAYKAQKENNWTFFDERQHLENLFSQRVNFILLLFPVMITVFCAVDDNQGRLIVSIAGVITLLVFYIPLIRTYFKLDIVQKICYRIPMGDSLKNNPTYCTHECYKTLPWYKKVFDQSSPALFMNGIAIMILFMFVLFVLTLCKVF